MSWLAEPLSNDFTARALVELVVLAVACGPLGVWVLLHRQAFAAESLGHGMVPGLVLAALAGAPLVLGAAGGVAVAAVAIALAGRDERLGPDVGVAVAVGTLFGLGALLALAPDAPPRLEELLFGDPLGVTDSDLVASLAPAAGVAVALAVLHRRLTVAAFDATAAASLGVRPHRASLALLVVIGAATVAAAPALGGLLLVALVLAPGAAALALARRLAGALALAAGLAVLAVVVGIEVSYHLDVAAGAAVAISAVALLLAAVLWPGAQSPNGSRPRARATQ